MWIIYHECVTTKEWWLWLGMIRTDVSGVFLASWLPCQHTSPCQLYQVGEIFLGGPRRREHTKEIELAAVKQTRSLHHDNNKDLVVDLVWRMRLSSAYFLRSIFSSLSWCLGNKGGLSYCYSLHLIGCLIHPVSLLQALGYPCVVWMERKVG